MNGAMEFPLGVAELSFRSAGGSLVRRSVLRSGVRVLSEQVPGARSATVGFWVAVGSRDERPGTYGATHFLEHLLFKGTRTRSAFDIAISFDAVGGEHNAMTAKEYTCFYAKVRDQDVPMAVEVLADMFTSSVLDPREFETERGVILEELAMADDDPADVTNERFFEGVFGDHPLGRPIGGSAESIRAVPRDAVLEHYRANYTPQDLVVTVAGAVHHDELVAGVERALLAAGWDLDTEAAPVERRDVDAEPARPGGSMTVVERPIEQAHVLLGVPGLVATDDRRSTQTVLNSILGVGMSSRLFQEVREKRGLAYSVYSFAPSYSDAGAFGMYAGCSPSRAGNVAELLLDQLRAVAEHGVSDAELQRARGALAGASALALEDSDTRMTRLGRSEITLGEFLDLDEALRRIALVTPRQVQELARDFATRPLSIAAVGAVDESMFAGLDTEPTAA